MHVAPSRVWSPPRSAFAGFRFPAGVIVVAVRWYPRYGLSYRDVEELLAERRIEVDHVTVYRWVQRFTPLLGRRSRFARHSPGDRWFVDETYVKVSGVWRYVYRAVDQYGQVIDVLLTAHRDAAAARRFFTRALRTLKVTPSEVVTDSAPGRPDRDRRSRLRPELASRPLRTRRRGLSRAADGRGVHRTRPSDLAERSGGAASRGRTRRRRTSVP
jgi:transposase-like protein